LRVSSYQLAAFRIEARNVQGAIRLLCNHAEEPKAGLQEPLGVAEISRPGGNKEFAQFLRIACGSSSELEYFTILVADLGYLSHARAAGLGEQVVEVRRMLSGLLAEVTSGDHFA
jgi:hypothetical protein